MNEYLKEHPTFVDSIFVENIRKRWLYSHLFLTLIIKKHVK